MSGSTRRTIIAPLLAALGAFAAFCAGGAMLAFSWMAQRRPELNETGPWTGAAAVPAPVAQIIEQLSRHFWAAASMQLAIGLVVMLVGLLLMRNRTPGARPRRTVRR